MEITAEECILEISLVQYIARAKKRYKDTQEVLKYIQ